jgi:Flp pilus assembly pilin Flp
MLHEPGGLDVTTLALRRLRRGESGTTAVELAAILPVLIVLLFGIIEGGRLMFTIGSTTTAAREAARFGSLVGENSGVAQYRDCTAIRSSIHRFAMTDADIDIRYRRPGDVGFDANCNGNSPSAPVQRGDRISITLKYDFTPIVPFLDNFGPFPIESSDVRTIGGGG